MKSGIGFLSFSLIKLMKIQIQIIYSNIESKIYISILIHILFYFYSIHPLSIKCEKWEKTSFFILFSL